MSVFEPAPDEQVDKSCDKCVDGECQCKRSAARVLRRFVMRGSQLVEVGTVVRETR